MERGHSPYIRHQPLKNYSSFKLTQSASRFFSSSRRSIWRFLTSSYPFDTYVHHTAYIWMTTNIVLVTLVSPSHDCPDCGNGVLSDTYSSATLNIPHLRLETCGITRGVWRAYLFSSFLLPSPSSSPAPTATSAVAVELTNGWLMVCASRGHLSSSHIPSSQRAGGKQQQRIIVRDRIVAGWWRES